MDEGDLNAGFIHDLLCGDQRPLAGAVLVGLLVRLHPGGHHPDGVGQQHVAAASQESHDQGQAHPHLACKEDGQFLWKYV